MTLRLDEQEVRRWRPEFPILETCTYLISNSLGAAPRLSETRLKEYYETWASRGVQAWEDRWWSMPAELGDSIAPLIGAGPGEVSIQPNVTMSQWVALSCLTSSRRKKIVYSEFNFPSVRYFYQAQPELEVSVVKSHDGITIPLDCMLQAIDEKTLLVPVSHVLFRSAFIQDVEAIIERCRAVGAYVLLDTYHSCGVLPVDLRRLSPDFVVGGVLKWLCGGPGAAFLWVNPGLAREVTPRLTGWMAHRDPFGFHEEQEWTGGSYRFQSGTPNIPGLYAALEGVRTIGRVGVERIRDRSMRLTSRIIELASAAGIEVKSPLDASERGGHVTLNPPHAEAVARGLLERGFMVDHRPGAGVRIAPHFYNTLEEIESVMAEINTLS